MVEIRATSKPLMITSAKVSTNSRSRTAHLPAISAPSSLKRRRISQAPRHPLHIGLVGADHRIGNAAGRNQRRVDVARDRARPDLNTGGIEQRPRSGKRDGHREVSGAQLPLSGPDHDSSRRHAGRKFRGERGLAIG